MNWKFDFSPVTRAMRQSTIFYNPVPNDSIFQGLEGDAYHLHMMGDVLRGCRSSSS